MEKTKKQRILVADDMSMDREVLTELLEDEFDVTAVADGGAVVKALDAEPGAYVCLLLDIFMPVMDGFAVLAHMREKGYDIPVIALTSITDSEGHIRCYESGVSELLEKPYDRKILLYKVRRMIARRNEELRLAGGNVESPVSLAAAEEKLPEMKLLKAFRSDFSASLAMLKKAIADGDNTALHAASHAFSGLEANLGVLIDG